MKKYKCAHCGVEFEREKAKRGGNVAIDKRTFCSKKCHQSFWNKEQWSKKRKPLVSKYCQVCNIEFTPNKKHPTMQVCCSLPCRIKLNTDVNAQRRTELRPKSAICQSDYCKKEFTPSHYGWGLQRFCSKTCYRREGQRRWRAKYPEKVKRIVRHNKWRGNWWKALERDSFACQLCFLKGSQDDTSKLLVHHLDGEGETKGKNHELGNLQTLCIQCHGRVHHSLLLMRKDGKLVLKFGDKYLNVE